MSVSYLLCVLFSPQVLRSKFYYSKLLGLDLNYIVALNFLLYSVILQSWLEAGNNSAIYNFNTFLIEINLDSLDKEGVIHLHNRISLSHNKR